MVARGGDDIIFGIGGSDWICGQGGIIAFGPCAA